MLLDVSKMLLPLAPVVIKHLSHYVFWVSDANTISDIIDRFHKAMFHGFVDIGYWYSLMKPQSCLYMLTFPAVTTPTFIIMATNSSPLTLIKVHLSNLLAKLL